MKLTKWVSQRASAGLITPATIGENQMLVGCSGRCGMAGFPWAGSFEGLSLEELLLLFMDPNEHHSEQSAKQRGEAWKTQTSPSEQSMSTLPEDRVHSFSLAFVRMKTPHGSLDLSVSLLLLGKTVSGQYFCPRCGKALISSLPNVLMHLGDVQQWLEKRVWYTQIQSGGRHSFCSN